MKQVRSLYSLHRVTHLWEMEMEDRAKDSGQSKLLPKNKNCDAWNAYYSKIFYVRPDILMKSTLDVNEVTDGHTR